MLKCLNRFNVCLLGLRPLQIKHVVVIVIFVAVVIVGGELENPNTDDTLERLVVRLLTHSTDREAPGNSFCAISTPWQQNAPDGVWPQGKPKSPCNLGIGQRSWPQENHSKGISGLSNGASRWCLVYACAYQRRGWGWRHFLPFGVETQASVGLSLSGCRWHNPGPTQCEIRAAIKMSGNFADPGCLESKGCCINVRWGAVTH